MAIIVFGGQKGGSGKTTLAVNIAAERASHDRKILLVDCDTQMSAMKWATRRKLSKVDPKITCIALRGEMVDEGIRDQLDHYDDIIVDTKGGLSQDMLELPSVLRIADKLITPAQTSQFDIDTFVEMDRLISAIRTINRNLRAFVVINAAPTQTVSLRARNAKEALSELKNYTMLDHVVRNLSAFEDTAAEGLGVTEQTRRNTNAVSDLLLLAEDVWA